VQTFKQQIDQAPFLWQPKDTFAFGQQEQSSYFLHLFRMPAISQTDSAVRFEQSSRPALRFMGDVEMEQQAQMDPFEESVKL
jgi:hypothetical protein